MNEATIAAPSEPVGHEFASRHRTTNPETDAHGGIELSIA